MPSDIFRRPAFTVFPHQRDDIPSSVSDADDTIDISSWGTPTAYWPSTSCDISQYFGPQQLILDITLCGDWCVFCSPPSHSLSLP